MYNWHMNEKMLMDSIDIKDHISKHLDVKHDAAVCPFHNDHDPSLKISSQKQIAKCFSCGWSGNVVKFHMDFHHVNKQKAMIDLSEEYGVSIEPFDTRSSTIDFSFAEVYSTSTPYFNFYLNNFEPAKNYMISRGISQEVINKFEIGICPRNHLLEQFLDSKFTRDQYIRTELFTSDGHPKYGSRIMIPLKDYSNTHTIGFVGRLVKFDKDSQSFSNDDTSNKYINPFTSTILGGYQKDSYLYGYYFAKNYQELYVVEGYMDVLAMNTVGYENTVALGGTAMTHKQFDLLKNKQLILALDSDRSGVVSALKYTKEYSYYSFRYAIFKNKDANDSLIDGKIEMKILNLYDFLHYILLSNFFELKELEDRIKFYNYILSIADALHNDVMSLSIKKLLLEHFGLNENKISDFITEALKQLGGI